MDSPAGLGEGREGKARPIRFWQRLGVRLAALFALVTFLAVALVGAVVFQRQKREVEDGVGTQLLNIARISALLIDPALHAEVQASLREHSRAYARLRQTLATIREEAVLPTPIYTLAIEDAAAGKAKVMVTSGGLGPPGADYRLAPEVRAAVGWTVQDGVARYTGLYHTGDGMWISAFALIARRGRQHPAVLVVDYPVEIYFDRLRELEIAILQASAVGALAALILGLIVARRITRPVTALTRGVARVAEGDLSQSLPVRSKDEVGQLTHAFNGMLAGLRQRDFIRNAFGRYVSPEVAKTLLESPEGLRLGGHKRDVTVLMSDLRGYTQFAEQGDPALVMDVLNNYLARMADIVIAYGGTVNEFIGDAIFAVFGAPLDHPDHAERAAAAALAMQRAMEEINRANADRGWPRLEMGIGVNTGDAVVGNIGSEQRAKYAVVGAAVNLAARVEGCTVGGQIFLTRATLDRVAALVDVADPVRVELKGIAEPLLLYQLRGIGGRFAQRLPAASDESDATVEVALSLRGWVVEGKRLAAEFAGTVCRLGRRSLDARLGAELSPLTNVRLRLRSPDSGQDSGDLYGKVVGVVPGLDGVVTSIRLTSVGAVDQELIERLIAR
jgi:class 3 adenylate cyclase